MATDNSFSQSSHNDPAQSINVHARELGVGWIPGVSVDRRARLRRVDDLRRIPLSRSVEIEIEGPLPTEDEAVALHSSGSEAELPPRSRSGAATRRASDVVSRPTVLPPTYVHGEANPVSARPSIRPAWDETAEIQSPPGSSKKRLGQLGWWIAGAALLLLGILLWPRAQRRVTTSTTTASGLAAQNSELRSDEMESDTNAPAQPGIEQGDPTTAMALGAVAAAPVQDPPMERRSAAAEPIESSEGVPRQVRDTRDVAPLGYDLTIARANVLLERGKLGAAARLFEAALRQRRQSPEALFGLGYVALEEGRSTAALDYFRASVDNGNPEGWIGLGDAYQALDNRQKALNAYQAYLQRAPGGPSQTIAKNQSEQILKRRRQASQ